MADVKAQHQHPETKKKHPVAGADDDDDDEMRHEKTRKAPLPTDKQRAELEATDNEVLALLALACFRENYDAAKSCLDDDDNNDKLVLTDPVDGDRRTVLHYCVQNRSTRLAALVIERDESIINAAEANGHTPLQLSVIAGNLPMAEYLLKSGADINRADKNQHSVAHWAVASQYKDIQTFRRFIDLFDKYNGDLSSRDAEKATPLHYAAQSTTNNDKQKDDMIEYLVAKKADVDSRDIYERTPLIWAATTGSDVGCRSLLKAGADADAKDTDGITALHCAASWGHVKCIEILTKEGATVDSPDINGCTPLFYSVIHRQPESTKLLIRRKANTNHQDHKGRSVTHCAAAIGSTDCLEILRSNKADMWLQSKKKGHYPIHEAAIQSHTGSVKFLLEKCSKDRKKDMNLGNINGRTCLHIAAMTGNFPLVDYLVKNGADINPIMISRERKLTPYDSALAKRQLQCADYLLRHGAKSAKQLKEEEEEEERRRKKEEHEAENGEEDGETKRDEAGDGNKVAGSHVLIVKTGKKGKQPPLTMEEDGKKGGGDAFDDWYDGADGNSKAKGQEGKGLDKGKGTKGGDGGEKKETRKENNEKKNGDDSSDEEEEEEEEKKRQKKDNKAKTKDKRQKPDKDNDNDDESKKRRPRRTDDKTYRQKQQQQQQQQQQRKKWTPRPRQGLSPQRPITQKLYKPYFSLIQEQVRVFELKRLAALKMQKSLKFERAGNEKAVVRRLARDFNEEARPEDRVPTGKFNRIRDFQMYLQGEYQEADDWEKRLKKIEKVDPLYDSRRGHRDDYDGTFPEYSSHVLPPVARNQQRKRDAAGGGSKGRPTMDDDRDDRRRNHSSDDDDDSNDDSARYKDDYDSFDDDDNRSNNNGNHGDGKSEEEVQRSSRVPLPKPKKNKRT